MSEEEEKIRQILKRAMHQPSPDFTARVMQQISSMPSTAQAPLQFKALKPLALAFGLIALLAVIVSLVMESSFMPIQDKLLSYLSTQQIMNIIFSLMSFWVLMLLRPWIKKQVYHLSGA